MAEMTGREEEALAEVMAAVRGWDVRLNLVLTFGNGGHAIQVEQKVPVEGSLRGRWTKVGPLLFPGEGQDLSDLLAMIGHMRLNKEHS